jgi:hypothetical protein
MEDKAPGRDRPGAGGRRPEMAGKDKGGDAKLTFREKIKFANEKPSSKDFGKSRAGWKASKDAQKGK